LAASEEELAFWNVLDEEEKKELVEKHTTAASSAPCTHFIFRVSAFF
jgi:hypothetical protein